MLETDKRSIKVWDLPVCKSVGQHNEPQCRLAVMFDLDRPVVSMLHCRFVFLAQLHHAFFGLIVKSVQFADLHFQLFSFFIELVLKAHCLCSFVSQRVPHHERIHVSQTLLLQAPVKKAAVSFTDPKDKNNSARRIQFCPH